MDSQPILQRRTKSKPQTPSGYLPLVAGTLTLSLLLLYFWLSGSLLPSDAVGDWVTPRQSTGLVLTYSTTPAFLIGSHLYAQYRTRENCDLLGAESDFDRESMRTLVDAANGLGPARNIAVTVVGFILGFLNIPMNEIVGSLDGPQRFAALSIGLGNLITWLVVAHVMFRRLRESAAIRRIGLEYAKVDLLRLDPLLAFGRIGTLHVLIVAIAVGLAAFQSLDAELRWVNYASALAAGIPARVLLLFLPMLGIRQNVLGKKRLALGDLEEAIAHADRELEPDALRYLSDLLRQRETIQNTREWPIDTTGVSRAAIYFIIPPIAWVGGALAEVLIQAAL